MKFAEKLRKLTEGRKLASVAEAAGINAGLLNNYINRGSEPGAGTALKLARALGVPVDWMIDDDADFPVPKEKEHLRLERIADDELMFEVCRRQREELIPFLKALDEAEKVDWMAMWKTLENQPITLQLPPAVGATGNILYTLNVGLGEIETFEPRAVSLIRHRELPGAERPADDFQFPKPETRFQSLLEKEGFVEVLRYYWANQMAVMRHFNKMAKEEGLAAHMGPGIPWLRESSTKSEMRTPIDDSNPAKSSPPPASKIRTRKSMPAQKPNDKKAKRT